MYQDYRYVGLQCVRIIVVGVTMYQDFSCGGLQYIRIIVVVFTPIFMSLCFVFLQGIFGDMSLHLAFVSTHHAPNKSINLIALA